MATTRDDLVARPVTTGLGVLGMPGVHGVRRPARDRQTAARRDRGCRRGCGSGFWGGQHPSLAHYVTGMGPMDGATTAAGGRSCCLSSRRCPQSFLFGRRLKLDGNR